MSAIKLLVVVGLAIFGYQYWNQSSSVEIKQADIAPTRNGVSENLTYTYYAARNLNPSRSLKMTLNEASPIRENGEVFHGHTKWYVEWRFQWAEKPDGSCKISNVSTNVSASITLPRLDEAPSEQRQLFDNFLSALRLHELGHFNIGKGAATAVHVGILNLPEMLSCKELETAANELGNRILDEHRMQEIQYDESTSHGKTQGAWLEDI